MDDFYPILISTTISYGIVENVIRELNEQNPYKYFVLSPYSNKSQQYGIFVVNEVGNLDMDAKTRKTMFSGKKLMLAANKAYLEAAQNSRGIIQNSCGITFVFHAKNTIVNVELFATGPFMEKFRPIYLYNWMFFYKTLWVKAVLLPRTRQFLLNSKFIQQSVAASSKTVVEDGPEPNISNAAEKIAVLISEERKCSADVQAIGLYSDAELLTRLGKATSCNDICTARSSTLHAHISEVEEESSEGEEEEENESDFEDDTESDISVNREGLHFPPAAMKLSAQPHPGGARVKHIARAVLASTQGQSSVLPAAAKPTQSLAFANPATAHKGGRPRKGENWLEEAAAVNDKILQEHPPTMKNKTVVDNEKVIRKRCRKQCAMKKACCRKKLLQQDKKTRESCPWYCQTCNVALHGECYFQYHTLKMQAANQHHGGIHYV